MITKTFKVIDDEGVGVRIFKAKWDADNFVKQRPEMQIEVMTHNIYEDMLNKCGECLL